MRLTLSVTVTPSNRLKEPEPIGFAEESLVATFFTYDCVPRTKMSPIVIAVAELSERYKLNGPDGTEASDIAYTCVLFTKNFAPPGSQRIRNTIFAAVQFEFHSRADETVVVVPSDHLLLEQ